MLAGSRQRLVVDLDQLAGVLGDVARVGDHHRDRLADMAHPVDREGKIRHRRPHHARDRPDHAGELRPGDDADHAGQRQRARCVDPADAGVRVRRAQDGGMLEPGHRRKIVDEARARPE